MLNRQWDKFVDSVSFRIYDELCYHKETSLNNINWDEVEYTVNNGGVCKSYAEEITEAMGVWNCLNFIDGFNRCTIGEYDTEISIVRVFKDIYGAVVHILITKAVWTANRLNYDVDGLKGILIHNEALRALVLDKIERYIDMGNL